MKNFGIVMAFLYSVTGCASMHARQYAAERAEITVTMKAPLERARAQVVSSFMANQLPVSSQQDLLVESKLPTEDGILGKYDLVARAVLMPRDSVTQVTLYGEEQRTSTAQLSSGGTTTSHDAKRVNEYSSGRAGRVWQQLQSIAAELRSPQ